MSRPSMGTWITATDRLRRSWVAGMNTGHRKEWHTSTPPKPVIGMYIGYRTYSDGVISYDSDYTADEWFEVWLVVPDMKSKPVAVLPVDVW